MFIDTSVIVAILSKEEDAGALAGQIEKAATRVTSALVYLETVMRLSTKLAADPIAVAKSVDAFLSAAGVDFVPLDRQSAGLAVEAFSRYGKGRGHPAQLNLADCLSYACARSHAIPLLYKGNDFSHTDLA